MTQYRTGELTIGVLTWNAPVTLANTLHSYQASGLSAAAQEKILFLQENNPLERTLGEGHGFTILHDEANIGIGNAYRRILDRVQTEFFLFLENDFVCIEPREAVLHRLTTGMRFLADGTADCVAYRHRRKPGYPNYAYTFIGQEEAMEGLLYTFHWLIAPEQRFPDCITRVTDERGEPWFLGTSRNGRAANYSNNPSLYRTEFISQVIRNEVSGRLSPEYRTIITQWAKNRGAPEDAGVLELNIVTEWKNHDYRIMLGNGLFSHLPLPEERFGGRSDLSALQSFIRKLHVLPGDRGGLPERTTHAPDVPSAHDPNRLNSPQKALIEMLIAHLFNAAKEQAENGCALLIPDCAADLPGLLEPLLRNRENTPFPAVLPAAGNTAVIATAERFAKFLPLYLCDVLTAAQLEAVLGEHASEHLPAALRRAFAVYLDGYGTC